jgi:hypothetical protein
MTSSPCRQAACVSSRDGNEIVIMHLLCLACAILAHRRSRRHDRAVGCRLCRILRVDCVGNVLHVLSRQLRDVIRDGSNLIPCQQPRLIQARGSFLYEEGRVSSQRIYDLAKAPPRRRIANVWPHTPAKTTLGFVPAPSWVYPAQGRVQDICVSVKALRVPWLRHNRVGLDESPHDRIIPSTLVEVQIGGGVHPLAGEAVDRLPRSAVVAVQPEGVVRRSVARPPLVLAVTFAEPRWSASR